MTDFSLTRADFPPGFLFGTANSAYQIEGHAQGGAGPTHWDSFAATPGNVANAENGDVACDHLNRWQEDLDLIAGAGLELYRFSTSWARVLPEGRGKVNAAGLDFYDRLVDGLLARGIRPMATLYHWELPSALADLGGWANPDISRWFADFADIMGRRLGDRLHATATINEPWCVSWLSHFLGHHAPGLRDIRATARAMHHVCLAHGRAVAALRAAGVGNIGAVTNMEYTRPADDSPGAADAARRYDAIYNRFFLGGMVHGSYPEEVLDGIGPHLPAGWQREMDTVRAPIDWVGLNYYTCKRIGPADGPWPALEERPAHPPLTEMGWEWAPDGLEALLLRIHRELAPGMPIIVTESGMAAPDRPGPDGAIEDADRIAYLDAHLSAVRRASAAGAPVRGYTVWSLMDNFEWALGYDKRFGLVHVDFETLARRPKASWHALARALARRS